jgi:hypothetical protein
LISSPVLGWIVARPAIALGRHASFLFRTHEAAGTGGVVDSYFNTVSVVAGALVPQVGRAAMEHRGLYLEPVAFCFFVLGVLFGWRKVRSWGMVYLYGSFLFAVIVIVASNPVGSLWRMSLLHAPVFILVGVGQKVIFDLVPDGRRAGVSMKVLAGCGFVLLHFLTARESYQVYSKRNVTSPPCTGELVINRTMAELDRLVPANHTVAIPRGGLDDIFRGLAAGSRRLAFYKEPDEIAGAAGGGALAAVMPTSTYRSLDDRKKENFHEMGAVDCGNRDVSYVLLTYSPK